LVCLAVGLALNFIARKTHGETFAFGPGRGEAPDLPPRADPVLIFGFVLGCYGAISLALVSALPGDLALARTGLVFAFLCVGGLIWEISNTRPTVHPTVHHPTLHSKEPEADEATAMRRKRMSRKLSVALAVMLNLAFAVLSSDRGLVQIVPPKASAVETEELEPIVVVAQRTWDPLDDHGSLF
jgi:hypothetical protein